MDWNYMQPVRIRFGNGMIRMLPEEIYAFGGSNGMLITSPSFVKSGLAGELCKASGGTLRHIYSDVSPNPDVIECDACARLLWEESCDFVVALGGGSVMDCAKAAATVCLTEHPVEHYIEQGKQIPQAHLPLIAIPTTSGTGSEVTCVSVLSDHRKGIKTPLCSDGFYPAVAIVDPELTYSLPPYMTACTGFDALCHGIEAYWSVNHQPICDALAVHAVRLVLGNLLQAYRHPDNATAREKMAEASVIAGLAFAMPKTSSAHACSYPLTNLLGIAHGEACALTITHFLHFNAEHGSDRPLLLAKELGYADVKAMADAIDELRTQTGLRENLKSYNLNDRQFEALVQGSMHPNLRNNPVKVCENDLRTIYNNMR